MTGADLGLSLDRVVAALGDRVSLAGTDPGADVRVSSVSIWLPGEAFPETPDTLVLCPSTRRSWDGGEAIAQLLDAPGVVAVVVWAGGERSVATRKKGRSVVLIASPEATAGELVLDIAQAISSPLEATSRRLTTLQRSLTQSLSEGAPASAIVRRLGKVCNASTAVISTDGVQRHSNGPLPQSLLFQEIRRAPVETQTFSVDGWQGVAVRIEDPVIDDAQYGWIIAASRRPGFPDSYAVSAVQLAASLVETSLRIDVLTRSQERAVQSALLEQAISLQPRRDDHELASKMSGVGIRFDEELRVVVIRPTRASTRSGQSRPALDVASNITEAFARSGIPCLISSRDSDTVLLVQCSGETARRALADLSDQGSGLVAGIGRIPRSVGEVADSYNDALLGMQAVKRRGTTDHILSFEDFDFATRLFADVGLDRMAGWAREFLAPLEGREALVDGLRSFLDHDQNINVAAAELNIHHNSLRYRLAKVEELLDISLRDPAAISSVFLALTALDMGRPQGRRALAGGARKGPHVVEDVEAPRTAAGAWSDDGGGPVPGVVLSPDR